MGILNDALYPVGQTPVQVPSYVRAPAPPPAIQYPDPNRDTYNVYNYRNGKIGWETVRRAKEAIRSQRTAPPAQAVAAPVYQAPAEYVTTKPATYVMNGAGETRRGDQVGVVPNPASQLNSAQDVINKYYKAAANTTAAQTNGIYNTAAALAAKDGWNLNQLVAAVKHKTPIRDIASYNINTPVPGEGTAAPVANQNQYAQYQQNVLNQDANRTFNSPRY